MQRNNKDNVQPMDKNTVMEMFDRGAVRIWSVDFSNVIESVRGWALQKKDGVFLIVVNEAMTEDQQVRTFKHEVFHITRGHLTSGITAKEAESEVVAQQENGFPCFDGWNLEEVYHKYKEDKSEILEEAIHSNVDK